ncbi:autotransporter-associated beta strand repeat-containing protein [Cereibacter changlensis]|uniref:Autotransporter-associated beta strand protein n=1 Tax=Cereibacter changlensis TaxID=402884 RepID=A0A2W7R7M6_9RHOB|nr:autotransporter-associated beta strand repeat-containing protein [Cereibacter changlensis]PZX56151.1 autotransporter-associated beta strand protein [Cereibacter changlensis]
MTLERPNETSPYLISGGLTFEDAAQSYLLDVKEGAYLGILGPVTNSSGVTQQFNVSGGAGGVISFIELQGETGSNVIYTAGENGRVRLRTSVPENSASFVLDGGRLEYSGSGVLELGSLTGTGTLAYELNGAETGTIRLGGFGTSDTVEVLGATIAQVGALTLEKVGAGTLIMTGSNGYSGGTRILGGTLQFGQGSFDSPLVGNVYTGDSEDSGRLAFGYEGDTSYSGVISGAGDLAILDGAVTLSGMNTFTGLTSISEGATLALTGQGRVNQSSGVEVNGALDVSGASSAAVKSISGSGIISVGGASLSLTDSTGSFAGNVTGTGGLSIDAGSLTLTGASDLTGQFGVGDAASLTVGDGETSGWISANVLNYGALTFDRSDGGTYSGRISGTGDITLTGGGSYILTGENSNSGSVTISEGTSVQLGDGGATGRLGGSGPNSGSIANDGTLIINRSSATTYAGVISGGGNLHQIGSGRLTLNGVNSFSGGRASRPASC